MGPAQALLRREGVVNLAGPLFPPNRKAKGTADLCGTHRGGQTPYHLFQTIGGQIGFCRGG